MAQERTGMNEGKDFISKVEDAVGGMVGKVSAAMGGHDTEAFLASAAMSNTYELQAAQIAEQRANSPEVRRFAQMMRQDHGSVPARMAAFVASAGAGSHTPETLDNRRQGMIDNLAEAAPDNFDRMYIDLQIMAHSEALTLFRGYADHGGNPEIRRFAAEMVPVLERHKLEAERLRGS